MNSSSLTVDTLNFLRALALNNNKNWFEANKKVYEAAKSDFEAFVGDLIGQISAFHELGALKPKDCIMRIYRDVRFSKDKTPYKTGFGAIITQGGKKSGNYGYYLHIEPGGASMAAGGMHDPDAEQLRCFRQAVHKDVRPLRDITEAPEFVRTFVRIEGDSLKTAPAGYAKDHPQIDLIRRKQLYVIRRFSDDDATSVGFTGLLAETFKTMKPFLDYLSKTCGKMTPM